MTGPGSARNRQEGMFKRVLGALRPGDESEKLRQAMDALKAGQVARAAQALADLAQRGHTEAEFQLARLYETGSGVVANMADAAYWHRRAADKNHAGAQARLATLLMIAPPRPADEAHAARQDGDPDDSLQSLFPRGATIFADLPEARRLAELSAKAGLPEGQALAGYFLANGIGGPPNPVKAAEYYLPAAETGQIEACLGLGTLLAGGFLGQVDHESARVWFEIAADGGNATAMVSLGREQLDGLGGPKDDEAAFENFARAADKGHVGAFRQLGMMYLEGQGVAADPVMAEEWLRKAAQRGDVEAMAELGRLIRDRNPQEALRFLSAAGERGNRSSQRILGQMYQKGEGVPQDSRLALYWLERAARGGDAEAQFELGVAYAVGQGVPRDFRLASTWSEAAARGGHSIAKINLGRFRMQGVGGARDPADALNWLKAALDDGEVAAIVALGELYAFWMDPPDLTRARLLFEKGVALGDPRSRDLLERINQSSRS